jgi:hypothetical protein
MAVAPCAGDVNAIKKAVRTPDQIQCWHLGQGCIRVYGTRAGLLGNLSGDDLMY